MEEQQALWRPPLDAFYVHGHHTMGQGWELLCKGRLHGMPWGELERRYDSLHGGELVDVLDAELGRLLGGGGPAS